MNERLFNIFALMLAFALAFAFPAAALAEDEDPSSSSSAASAAAEPATSVDANAENIVDPTQRADNSFIYDTTIEDILAETSLHDGRIVQFVGEAIGDRVLDDASGKYCWVTVESMADGSDANISVYMTVEQAEQIDHFGRYGVTGTTLQIRGTFNQACSNHEGLVDVHATNVGVMARGVEHPDTLNLSNFGFGIFLIIVGAALMAAFYFVRERMR